MQNRHDQRRGTFTRQSEGIVVLAVRHQQLRVEVAHVPVRALTGSKARNAALKPGFWFQNHNDQLTRYLSLCLSLIHGVVY
ncbi:hypothetical protein [Pseudomonas fragi]|uniref:hypothetical protein n=1 Tax=Pseudomonas fragi TaxID=296 RepID=UPI001F3C071C|nr:hypothetical protein [Pseudomonas fragi]MCF6760352.1 hypothetical protein [Pseudomonas fragi]MCK6252747.1 hypothetical protein [Pseudomonas fragi]